MSDYDNSTRTHALQAEIDRLRSDLAALQADLAEAEKEQTLACEDRDQWKRSCQASIIQRDTAWADLAAAQSALEEKDRRAEATLALRAATERDINERDACIAELKEQIAQNANYSLRAEANVKELREALVGLLDEFDRLMRYGSPMAKAANPRVAAARVALLSCEAPAKTVVEG